MMEPCLGASSGRMNSRTIVSLLLIYLVTFVSAGGVSSSTENAGLSQDKTQMSNDQIIQMDQDVNTEEVRMQCPNAEDIYPCTCKQYWTTKTWDIDCSSVQSEDQLRQAFRANFPFINFDSLTIYHNSHLKVLESGVFGNVTFGTIYIDHSEIEVVETDAFSSSYETATDLDVSYSNLVSFPFDDIDKFSRLSEIDISGNKLDTIPLDTFHGSTTLTEINILDFTGTYISTFENIPKLKELYIPVNNLPIIPANFFKTGSENIKVVCLNFCNISSIEPDAFDIVHGLEIRLYGNFLTTLEEVTWRPLFEARVGIDVRGNPLECGCDIAWLFGDDHLVDQVLKPFGEETTCSDGQSIHDLDPSIFDNC